jgi:hypothetical protein
MNRDDMIISHVFDTERLTIGKCYKFQCGNATEYMGVLSFIGEDILIFHVADIVSSCDCTIYPYEITAKDFYNDETAYVIEMT